MAALGSADFQQPELARHQTRHQRGRVSFFSCLLSGGPPVPANFTRFNEELTEFLDAVHSRSPNMVILNLTFRGSISPAAFFSARSFAKPSAERPGGYPLLRDHINVFYIPRSATGNAAGMPGATVAGELSASDIAEILRAAGGSSVEVTKCKCTTELAESRLAAAQRML